MILDHPVNVSSHQIGYCLFLFQQEQGEPIVASIEKEWPKLKVVQ